MTKTAIRGVLSWSFLLGRVFINRLAVAVMFMILTATFIRAEDLSRRTKARRLNNGLGATGGGANARGEFADLDTLPRQLKRAAVLIYRLTR